jgi:UDPglucose 6-dehydrogenase
VKVAVIGTGYVGTVAAVAFAAIGNDVVGVEADESKLDALRHGTVPFHEPGLDEHLRRQLAAGTIAFTADMATGAGSADVVFLCVGTPPGTDGRPDLTALRSATTQVARVIEGTTVVITKSTVPIGWAEEMRSILEDQASPDSRVLVVSNPEFLREGSAVKDFLYPDRVVLGGDEEALDLVARLYRPILEQTFAGGDRSHQPALIRTDLATAETVKYAANGFLATKIAYINEIARICDAAAADVETVAEAVGLDNRIERKFLGAGIGYGGSCFAKDLQALGHFGVDHEVDLPILNAVNPSNVTQRLQVVEKLRRGLAGGLDGTRVALLGLAYKPNTDDVREAPSVTIARALMEDGATVVAYDPVVKHLEALPDLVTASDPYDAVDGADAAILVTEWREFGDLEFGMVARLMRGDLVVDGRNWLDGDVVVAAGLRYDAMGRRTPGSLASQPPVED